jgi:hypothetical protein
LLDNGDAVDRDERPRAGAGSARETGNATSKGIHAHVRHLADCVGGYPADNARNDRSKRWSCDHCAGEDHQVPAERVTQAGRPESEIALSLGYRPDDPRRLASDLRTQHLSLDVTRTSEEAYGVVYEVEGPIRTSIGKNVRLCSIWQVDTGTDVPRLITKYPR